MGQERYAEAEPSLLAGYGGMKHRASAIPSDSKARIEDAVRRLVRLYQGTIQPDKVAEWQEVLVEINQSLNSTRETANPDLR